MSAAPIELFVEKYLKGVRLDRFLTKHFRNYSSWRLQRIVRAGGVQIDDEPAETVSRVYPGQRVTVRLVEPPDKLLEPEEHDLEILFEDPWLLVINKPAGMICHPVGDYQSRSLCNAVQRYLNQQTTRAGLLRPGIVHRLDRQTSGVIVVPKDHFSHRMLSIQWQDERTSKCYIALAEGVIRQDERTIDFPIGQAPGDTILMSAKAGAIDAKPSRTLIRVLERFPQHTLVEAVPFTGRNHQIRVHLAEIGHPVVADEYYEPGGRLKPKRPEIPAEWQNDEWPNAVDAATGLTRHFLHAFRLSLTHPVTQEWMEFRAPLTPDLTAALHRLSRESREPAEAVPMLSRWF